MSDKTLVKIASHKWVMALSRKVKNCRSSHWRCSVTNGVLRNFAKFTRKQLCQSQFLRTPFLKNTSGSERFWNWPTKNPKVCISRRKLITIKHMKERVVFFLTQCRLRLDSIRERPPILPLMLKEIKWINNFCFSWNN